VIQIKKLLLLVLSVLPLVRLGLLELLPQRVVLLD
jgi:hypothetical protein